MIGIYVRSSSIFWRTPSGSKSVSNGPPRSISKCPPFATELSPPAWLRTAPMVDCSHGGNTGSSPVGSASKIKSLGRAQLTSGEGVRQKYGEFICRGGFVGNRMASAALSRRSPPGEIGYRSIISQERHNEGLSERKRATPLSSARPSGRSAFGQNVRGRASTPLREDR